MNPEQTVYQYIEKAILENRMPPGTRLRELQLAEIFGVKRGLIRKVLSQLTNARLVDHIPHVGAQVACPSLKDGQDLFAVRVILEKAIVGELSGNLDKEQARQLRQHLQKEKQAYQIGDMQKGVHLSAGFHRLLAEMTGNRVLQEFLQDILNRTPLVMMSLSEIDANRGCVNHDHEHLVDALVKGDDDEAIAIMEQHLQQLEDMFSGKAEQPPKDLAEIFQQT